MMNRPSTPPFEWALILRLFGVAVFLLGLAGCGRPVPQPPLIRHITAEKITDVDVKVGGQLLEDDAVFAAGQTLTVQVGGQWTSKPDITAVQPVTVDLIAKLAVKPRKGKEAGMGRGDHIEPTWKENRFAEQLSLQLPRIKGKFALQITLEAQYEDGHLDQFWVADKTIELR